VSTVSEPLAPSQGARAVRVTRSRRPTWWLSLVALAGVVVLAILPYIVFSSTTNLMVNVFILIIMASMWNLLAGYAGLVSVGQQAFVGLGAYSILIFAQHGVNPFLGLPLAVLVTAVIGVPVWWLVSRLRTAYFAIATWVVASVFYYLIIQFPSLGGGTGTEIPGALLTMDSNLRLAYTYWAALIVLVASVGGIYMILRSRIGLVLTAVRDDEVAARSSGGRVGRVQRFVFVVAAAGCGGAGALLAISELNVEPTAAFSVLFSAQMIFATIIGGLGTIEGPILGAVIFYALQQSLASHGAWYFIVLGLVAIAVALWARRGLWGLVADRFNIRIFPVGYWLWPAGEGRRRPGAQGRRSG
jgi:branched-chain amino acid transport system permease protein